MTKSIYLDNAATTEVFPEVLEAMEPYYGKYYGNAYAVYELGTEARNAIELARWQIAASIMARPEEIYFTSGGSESDNWAIKMTALQYKDKGRHIITDCIEHAAVLQSCKYLEKMDYRVTYLEVTKQGILDMTQLEKTVRESEYSANLRDKATLISVMYANNEIGTLQPIEEIGMLARRKNIVFHTDAVQAIGQVPISVHRLPIDLLSASGHKFHGPKGVGFLYVREGIDLPSYIHGGAQERHKRAGTENVAGIVGMAKALTMSCEHLKTTALDLKKKRDYMLQSILREIPRVWVNGDMKKRLPGNINVSFEGVMGSALLILLEEQGIYASAASACSAGKQDISHVIRAIGTKSEYAPGTIRFSLGKDIIREDIDRTVAVLKDSVAMLRG